MGGGVGVSVHAPIRIATEYSVFAMPGRIYINIKYKKNTIKSTNFFIN